MIIPVLFTRFPASTFLAVCGISSALVVSIAGATALTAQTGWFGSFFGGSSSEMPPITTGATNDGTAPTGTIPAPEGAAQNTTLLMPGTTNTMTTETIPSLPSPFGGSPTAPIPSPQPQGQTAVPQLFGPTYEPTADRMPLPALPGAATGFAGNLPTQMPSPLTCDVCQYEPVTECDGKARGDDCNHTLTRGQEECVWEAERCVGYFQANCERQVSASTSDWKIAVKEFPTAATYPSTCTTRNYDFNGHSARFLCRRFFQNISLCIQGADVLEGTPVAFNFRNNGCSTFGNAATVYQEIARIRSTLPPGVSLTVRGNQATASQELLNTDGDQTLGDLLCLTHWTLQLQRDAPVRETFGECTPGAWCPPTAAGESARCSLNGTVSRQKCCTDPYTADPANATAWTMGAACPVPYCRTFQTCNTPGRSVSCSRNGTMIEQVCCISNPFAASATLPNPEMSWTFGERCPVPDCRTGQTCGRLEMPVSCMQNNRVTRQQCCLNDADEAVWTGDVLCRTSFYGTCTGTSTALFSSDARNASLRDAYICLGAREARCTTFSRPSLCTESIMSNGIFSRTVRQVCPYVCSPRL